MKNTPSSRPFALLVAAAWLACAPAAAQFRTPEDAIDYRQGVMTVMNAHLGRLGAMADGKVPFDAAAAQANADLVVTLARLPWSAFVAGSDDGDTNAKPEIWSRPGDFKAASQRLQDASAALADAARSGRVDALKTAFDATAAACKACHEDFRKKH